MPKDCFESCADSCSRFADNVIRLVEPLFVATAVVLVTLDAYVFFTTVLVEVIQQSGHLVACMHVCIALWLLFNVLFNHMMCLFCQPGNTSLVDKHELRTAMEYDWHWCKKCDLPKPPLSHHCSVCNKCTLRMDHHCPWMGNCVGFFNFKFFFLYLWWMWIGSMYSMAMTWIHLGGHFGEGRWMHRHFLLFLMFVLAAAVFLGLSFLLGWQFYMVATGQGTIDSMTNYYDAKDAKEAGHAWRNPYDLGVVENFKEIFDVRGRFWWISWCLPSMRAKRGNGYLLPQRQASSRLFSV